MTPLEAKARDFAICAHGDQKYGDHPYVKHLDDVAEIVKPHGEEAVVVAYLHDVIENTDVSLDELGDEFGWRVSWSVFAMSDSADGTRSEKKAAVYARLRVITAPSPFAPALIVKPADRLANVRACLLNNPGKLAMYRAEHAEFRAACFRAGLCDGIWAELDGALAEHPIAMPTIKE